MFVVLDVVVGLLTLMMSGCVVCASCLSSSCVLQMHLIYPKRMFLSVCQVCC